MEYAGRGRVLYAPGAETGSVSLARSPDSWAAAPGAPAAYVWESGSGMGKPVRVRGADTPTGHPSRDPAVPGVPRAQDGGPGDSAAVGRRLSTSRRLFSSRQTGGGSLAPGSPAPGRRAAGSRARPARTLEAEGASNKHIATQLVIELSTARKHVSNLLSKLGAANRTQAIARAREYALL